MEDDAPEALQQRTRELEAILRSAHDRLALQRR
jgi:hypothetical protein